MALGCTTGQSNPHSGPGRRFPPFSKRETSPWSRSWPLPRFPPWRRRWRARSFPPRHRTWRATTLKRRRHGARLHPRLIKSAFWAQTAVSAVFEERNRALEPFLAADPISTMAPQVARPKLSTVAPHVARPDPKTAPPWRSAAPPANKIRILGPHGGFGRFRREKRRPGAVPGRCSAFRHGAAGGAPEAFHGGTAADQGTMAARLLGAGARHVPAVVLGAWRSRGVIFGT